jgi:hypothetical protein
LAIPKTEFRSLSVVARPALAATDRSLRGAALGVPRGLRRCLADETGLGISVCHFPPGTSTWNKIERRLFSFITKNWPLRPDPFHGEWNYAVMPRP